MHKAMVQQRARERWHEWAEKAKWFGKGTSGARVFHKKNSRYPNDWFSTRGELVKVFPGITEEQAVKLFYGHKIAHELFPENTIEVNAIRIDQGFGELHMKRAKYHPELETLFEHLRKKQNNDIYTDYDWRLLDAAEKVRQKNIPKIHELEYTLNEAGITIDNSLYNISHHNPKKPVCIEVFVKNLNKLEQYITKQTMPAEKRKRLLGYIQRIREGKFKQKKAE